MFDIDVSIESQISVDYVGTIHYDSISITYEVSADSPTQHY